MIFYVLSYVGGIATGVTLLLAHQHCIRKAVTAEQVKARRETERMRAENARLREDIQAYELSAEAARARAQGKITGIQEARNMSNYEKFEQACNPNGRRSVNLGGRS